MRDKKYILLDWFASGISFLLVLFVYRESQNTLEVGYSGWMLSLLTTSLFLSGASQYFAMFYKLSIFQIYSVFIPLFLVEVLLLRTVIGGIEHLVLSLTIGLNLYFAIYRGRLMGDVKLIQAALWNVLEQALRMFALLFFLYGENQASKEALLNATLVAYFASAVSVFFVGGRQKGSLETRISKEHFIEAIWYSVIHLGIYSLSNLDLLLLKSFPLWEGKIALAKPWGQVLSVATIPFVNVYLSKVQHNKKTRGIINYYIGFVSIYVMVSCWLGDWINQLLFHKPLPSVSLLILILIEHILFSVFIIFLYHQLQKRSRGFLENLQSTRRV